MVVQYSIDIEIDENDKFNEDDIERALTSYWYAEGIKDKEIRGIAWKATWNSSLSYDSGFGPDSSD